MTEEQDSVETFMDKTFLHWKDSGIQMSEFFSHLLLEVRKEKRALFLNLSNLQSATIGALFAAKIGLGGIVFNSDWTYICVCLLSVSILISYFYIFGILSKNNKEIEWIKKHEENKTSKILDIVIGSKENLITKKDPIERLNLAMKCNDNIMSIDEESRTESSKTKSKGTFDPPREWVEWFIIIPFILGYISLLIDLRTSF